MKGLLKGQSGGRGIVTGQKFEGIIAGGRRRKGKVATQSPATRKAMNATTITITTLHEGEKPEVASIADKAVEAIRRGGDKAWYTEKEIEEIEAVAGGSVEKEVEEGATMWTVVGYYYEGHKPYSSFVAAVGPDEAVRKTLKQIEEDVGADLLAGTGLSYEESNLVELTDAIGINIISVAEGIVQEHVHETSLG
jgi:hypothetical protein